MWKISNLDILGTKFAYPCSKSTCEIWLLFKPKIVFSVSPFVNNDIIDLKLKEN